MKLLLRLRARQSFPPRPRGEPRRPALASLSPPPHMARRYVCGGCFLLLCLFSASLRCSARCIALRACLGEKIPRPARFALPLAPLLRSLRSLLPSQRIITMQHGGGFTASLAAARPCRPSPCSSRQVPHAVLGVIASCGSLWERSLRLRVRSPPPLVRGERGSGVRAAATVRAWQKRKALGRWHSESFAQNSSLTRKILICKRLVWADVGSCGSSDRNR